MQSAKPSFVTVVVVFSLAQSTFFSQTASFQRHDRAVAHFLYVCSSLSLHLLVLVKLFESCGQC